MAFDETVYVLLEGGLVMPISHVTAELDPSDVVVYDGSTYRDDVSNGAGNTSSDQGPHVHLLWENSATGPVPTTADDITNQPAAGLAEGILEQNTTDPSGAQETNTKAYYALSDFASHIPPRYHGKKRTMWSFARTVSAAAAFTHVVWADQVIATGSHPPYRVGMTPTSVT